jgi:glycosyltransferase involved in cell wall biosynthesis
VDEQARRLGVAYVDILERHPFDSAIWTNLRRLIRTHTIDIVHAHEYKSDVLARILAWTDGVIPLATVHGWTGHSFRERRVYYPLDKRVLRGFPHVVAVSGQIRDDLVRSGTRVDRISVVLNGIDAEQFRRDRSHELAARAALGVMPSDLIVGSVGRLEPQKRFDLLIEAFARVSARARPRAVKLLIAGDGSQRASLEALIDRLGIAPSCRLLGHRTDVVGLHHALDLFVQSSDYEGTPNAVLEAMALQTPVVATDVGGTGELLRDHVDGVLVQPGDSDVIAAAIEKVFADPDASARRAASARRRVETDLSFEARSRKVEQIYRNLAAANRRHGAMTRVQ